MFVNLTGSDLRYCSIVVDAGGGGGGVPCAGWFKGGMIRSVLSGSSLK